MSNLEHVTVYRQPGRFGGWPANYGIWSWDNEIVVAFTLGYMDLGAGFHKRDSRRPFVTMQARSLDGGVSWEVAEMPLHSPQGVPLSAYEHQAADAPGLRPLDPQRDLFPLEEPLDLSHPDLALMCGRTGLHAGALSWLYASTDRCQHWAGPYRLPDFGLPGISARTVYLVDGRDSCTLFLTAAKSDGREGRVFCVRTEDGGMNWRFLSWIGPEPAGYSIMPSTVRLPDGALLTAIRRKGTVAGGDDYWIELYRSEDGGASWEMSHPRVAVNGGNPPAMIMLADGRICLTYGYRLPPYGIRAKLSDDQGLGWGQEIVLRDDGGDADLGYPRTVQRPDGRVVTAYYFNDHLDGERYIGATIWEP